MFVFSLGKNYKSKKGYEIESIDKMIIRSIIISAVILAFSYISCQCTKEFHLLLIIVAIVVLVYGFITSKTVLGRHFYAVGGNEKLQSLVLTQARFIL